jgi:hypothetical protein
MSITRAVAGTIAALCMIFLATACAVKIPMADFPAMRLTKPADSAVEPTE